MTHQIFTIDEILELVVASLQPEQPRHSGEKAYRTSLNKLYLPLTTVSRAFSSVALDALWKDLDGLDAIDSLRIAADGQSDLPARLERYTRRVRSLKLSTPDEHLAHFLENHRPLFPRLASLDVRKDSVLDEASGSPFDDARLVFSPTIKNLRMGIAQRTSRSARFNFAHDMEAMCKELPLLQDLCLEHVFFSMEVPPDVRLRAMHALGALQHIAVLTISLALVICPDIVVVLSTLPRLRQLHLLDADEEWLDAEQIVSAGSGFGSLERLVLQGVEHELFFSLLTRFPKCPVRHLELLRYISVPVPIQQQIMHVVADRFSSSLRRFRVKDNGDIAGNEVPLDFSALLHLRSADLEKLEFFFEGWADFTNKVCADISRSWPHLRHVFLPAYYTLGELETQFDNDDWEEEMSRCASFDALRMFAKHCPALETLQIRLNLSVDCDRERVGPLTPQTKLRYLDLRGSFVDDVSSAHSFLVECFPSLQRVAGSGRAVIAPPPPLEELCSMFGDAAPDEEESLRHWSNHD